MNRDVDGMLDAFQDYYANGSGKLLYNETQRRALHELLDSFSKSYLRVLFGETIADHETKWRTLPDVALIRKVIIAYPADAYSEQPRNGTAITDDAGWTPAEQEKAIEQLKAIVDPVRRRRRLDAGEGR